MTLPRLELTENPNKNNDFIIFRYPLKGQKIKQTKNMTKKRFSRKVNQKVNKKGTRKGIKGFFNIF